MNTTAIMQPTFFPWIGFFDMIDQVDTFVLYDDVQLAKRSWQVRNKIKNQNGEFFLSVPVKKTKNRDDLLICETEISYDENWQIKHLKNIETSYRKTHYFEEVYNFIKETYCLDHKLLSNFNINFILDISKKIGIKTNFLKSSELNDIKGFKDVRLASICKKINTEIYLSAQGSASYIEAEKPGGEIVNNSIQLYYHFYKHPVYNQMYGSFIPYMSVIDLLFNVGFENSLELIRSGRENMMHYSDYRNLYLK